MPHPAGSEPPSYDPQRDGLLRDKLRAELRGLLLRHRDKARGAAERITKRIHEFVAEHNSKKRKGVEETVKLLPLAREIVLDRDSLEDDSGMRVDPQNPPARFEVIGWAADRPVPHWMKRAYEAVGRWDNQVNSVLWNLVGHLKNATQGRIGSYSVPYRVNLTKTSAEDAYVFAQRVLWATGKLTPAQVRAELDPEQVINACATPWFALAEMLEDVIYAPSDLRRTDGAWWDVALLFVVADDPSFDPSSIGLDPCPPWSAEADRYGFPNDREGLLSYCVGYEEHGLEIRNRNLGRLMRQVERAAEHFRQTVSSAPSTDGRVAAAVPRVLLGSSDRSRQARHDRELREQNARAALEAAPITAEEAIAWFRAAAKTGYGDSKALEVAGSMMVKLAKRGAFSAYPAAREVLISHGGHPDRHRASAWRDFVHDYRKQFGLKPSTGLDAFVEDTEFAARLIENDPAFGMTASSRTAISTERTETVATPSPLALRLIEFIAENTEGLAMPVADLPSDLANPDLLTVCEDSRFIRFMSHTKHGTSSADGSGVWGWWLQPREMCGHTGSVHMLMAASARAAEPMRRLFVQLTPDGGRALAQSRLGSNGAITSTESGKPANPGERRTKPQRGRSPVAKQRARTRKRREKPINRRTKADKPARTPLSDRARAVKDLLRALSADRGMTGRQITKALSELKPPIFLSQSSLTKDVIPELKLWGLKNRRRIGYFFPKADSSPA